MKFVVVLLFLCSMATMAQNKLSISVEGVRSSQGEISIAVYNESHGFLTFDRAFKADSTTARRGTTELTIDGLPDGTYAIALFHDENGNKRLDTNWLGIPKEDVAFSIAKMKTFGPPCFEDCAFTLLGDGTLKILF